MQIAGHGGFTFTGVYDEIIEPQRIAYHADLAFGVTRVLVEFFEQGEKTTVVLTQEGFPDENLCKTVSQGTTGSFDELDSIFAGAARVHQ